jgi:hypothetical protein
MAPEDVPPLDRLLHEGKLADSGACWNCGFLCHKDEHNRHISSYAELTTDNREWGRFYPLMERWAPWCFRYEPIGLEIANKLGRVPRVVIQDSAIQDEQNDAALEIVTQDRQCAKWTKYRPGLRPKDHSDELFMREIEESRKNFEQTMEGERRKWELEKEEERRKFEERLDAQADAREGERYRWGMWLTLAAVLLAVAEVTGTILGLPAVTRLLGLD